MLGTAKRLYKYALFLEAQYWIMTKSAGSGTGLPGLKS